MGAFCFQSLSLCLFTRMQDAGSGLETRVLLSSSCVAPAGGGLIVLQKGGACDVTVLSRILPVVLLPPITTKPLTSDPSPRVNIGDDGSHCCDDGQRRQRGMDPCHRGRSILLICCVCVYVCFISAQNTHRHTNTHTHTPPLKSLQIHTYGEQSSQGMTLLHRSKENPSSTGTTVSRL